MKDGEGANVKRPKLENVGKPIFARHVIGDWVVVILSSGRKFFHNVATSQSIWSAYGVDELQDAMEKMNKTELLLAIARTRGFDVENAQPSGGPSLEVPSSEQSEEPAFEEPAFEESSQFEKPGIVEYPQDEPQASLGISLGYSSSDDSSDDENNTAQDHAGPDKDDIDEEKEEDQNESDKEDMQGINLSDFSDLDDPQGPETFKSLFEKYSLTPFDSWELVSERMVHDPEYLSVDTNQERKAIFDEWCKEQMVNQRQTNNVSDAAQFVAFIKDAQKQWKRKLYFAEFKRKYRSDELYKSSKLLDKQKESIYKECMAFDKERDKHSFLVKKLINSSAFANAVRQVGSSPDKISNLDLPSHLTESAWMLWLSSPNEIQVKNKALMEAIDLLNGSC